jgi:hypothetical protein
MNNTVCLHIWPHWQSFCESIPYSLQRIRVTIPAGKNAMSSICLEMFLVEVACVFARSRNQQCLSHGDSRGKMEAISEERVLLWGISAHV